MNTRVIFNVIPGSVRSTQELIRETGLVIQKDLSIRYFVDLHQTIKPHCVCAQLGERNIGKSPKTVVLTMKSGETGLTIHEFLCFLVNNKDYSPNNTIDLVGSRYKDVFVPSVYKIDDKWVLSAVHMDIIDPKCGGATYVEYI